MKSTLRFIVLAILILAGGFWLARRSDSVGLPVDNTLPATSTQVTTTPPSSSTSTVYMLRVTTPVANALVKSPVLVSGQARGHWYFEASFPVRVLDANGKELGVVPAQAQGEWMTTEFVPFSVSVPFASSTTATGFVVLEKDNPSGLPEHAAELRIPVRFR